MSASLGFQPAFSDLPQFKAGFTTREGGLSTSPFDSRNLGFFAGDAPETVANNWRKTLADAGLVGRPLALPRLVHGTDLVVLPSPQTCEMKEQGGLLRHAPSDCDAVASRNREWVLAVTMADCLAILLADPATGLIGAVHAGWRGTRDGILEVTLRRLFDQGEAYPESLRLAMGPALSAPRLGLGAEVTSGMESRYLQPLTEAGGLGLDMRSWNRDQALACGVAEAHMEQWPLCTYDNPDLFFSYRRDGARSGRMAAFIAWA